MTRSTNSTAPVEHSASSHRTERTSLPGERVRRGMSPSSTETGQFTRANWDYLESLKRLVDTNARGLDAGATEDN